MEKGEGGEGGGGDFLAKICQSSFTRKNEKGRGNRTNLRAAPQNRPFNKQEEGTFLFHTNFSTKKRGGGRGGGKREKAQVLFLLRSTSVFLPT